MNVKGILESSSSLGGGTGTGGGSFTLPTGLWAFTQPESDAVAPGSAPVITDIADIEWFHDGKIYSGSGAWLNQVVAPSSGAAQSAYNVTPTNAALHVTNSWNMDGTGTFAFPANSTFIKSLAKTTAGNDFTYYGVLQTPAGLTVNCIFATAQTDGSVGVIFRIDSTGKLKADFYDGTTHVTIASGATLSPSTFYIWGIKYNHDAATFSFAVNSDTWQDAVATFTDAITADPTYVAKLAAQGNGASVMTNGTKLFSDAMFTTAHNNATLATVNAAFKGLYTPPAAVAPSAPTVPIPQAGHTFVDVSVFIPSDGGAALTDLVWQYKLSTEPTTWSTFSHTASAQPRMSITGLTDGLSYDFRVAATNSIGTSAYSPTVSATPGATGSAPKDISGWKLTLPVNASGNRQGSAAEIAQGSVGAYHDSYFGLLGGSFFFNVADAAGALTGTAKYPRCELRDVLGEVAYNAHLDFTCRWRVPQLGVGEKAITMQIHDIQDPRVKIVVDGKAGNLRKYRALYKATEGAADTEIVFLDNVAATDFFQLRLEDVGTAINFYVNGATSPTATTASYSYSGANGNKYGKFGCYYQKNDAAGKVCIVEHVAPV